MAYVQTVLASRLPSSDDRAGEQLAKLQERDEKLTVELSDARVAVQTRLARIDALARELDDAKKDAAKRASRPPWQASSPQNFAANWAPRRAAGRNESRQAQAF